MTTESFIKSLERFLTPQLNEIKGELKAINTRIDALDEKIDTVRNELKADINRLDNKIDSLDEKIDIKITALSEKVDYMNKFNERLFNLIHPAGQK